MQRSENYKTLIFSEMSVEDQERIMELMVNNNVEFEQSQDGNYFATIRLIHRPQREFDAGESASRHQRSAKRTAKSKSPGGRKLSPTEQRYYDQFGDGRYENKMRELENYDRPVTARARLTQNKPAAPAPKPTRSPFQSKPPPALTSEAASQRKTEPAADYEQRRLAGTLAKKGVVENEKQFENFIELLNLPAGLRAKRMNVGALVKITEEVYSACFSKNSSSFKQNLTLENDPQMPKTRFPRFLHDWLQSKHKHRKLFEQNSADLLASVDFHRHESHEVQTFALFLSEQYDASDLIFFLYVRFLTERELNIQFASPQYGKKTDVDIRQVLMSSKTALKVAKIFFDEDEQLLKNFMSQLDQHYIQQPGKADKLMLPVSIFLGLILEEFHRQKKTQQQVDVQDEVRGFEERSQEDDALAQHLRLQQQQEAAGGGHETAPRGSYYGAAGGVIHQEMSEEVGSSRVGAHTPSQPRQTPPAVKRSSTHRRESGASTASGAKMSEELLLLKETIFRHIQMKKVKGLVNGLLQGYSDMPHEMLQEIGENLYNMLLKKVDDLLDALFRNDKMRWLGCLMIEDDPDDEQLNYIENLQMLVRQLQHSAKESIPYHEVDQLASLILQTPELQRELAKLVSQMVATLA